MLVEPINPKIVTILTTYKCSAACKECCFQCTPKITVRLSYEEIESFILEAHSNFKDSLELCVFTGGECTLLGEDLFKAIELVKNLGMKSRIVTNASWAKTKKAADRMIDKLLDSGLNEINYSTGDNHQEWVPFESIINACEASCNRELITLVSIESFADSTFSYEDFVNNDRIKYIKEKTGCLSEVKASWISLKNPKTIEKSGRELDETYNFQPCDSVLNFLGINPLGNVINCCGLTMEYIPCMKAGKYQKGLLKEMYYNNFNDFMKIWLKVDGPEKILYYAYQKNKNLEKYIKSIVHPCQACAIIYKNPEVRETLNNHYKEIVTSTIIKYENMKNSYKITT